MDNKQMNEPIIGRVVLSQSNTGEIKRDFPGKLHPQKCEIENAQLRQQLATLTAELSEVKKVLDVCKLALHHDKPSSCYATGILTGTAMDGICIACHALDEIKKLNPPKDT